MHLANTKEFTVLYAVLKKTKTPFCLVAQLCYFTFDSFPIVKNYGFSQTKIHETFSKENELHRLRAGRAAKTTVVQI